MCVCDEYYQIERGGILCGRLGVVTVDDIFFSGTPKQLNFFSQYHTHTHHYTLDQVDTADTIGMVVGIRKIHANARSTLTVYTNTHTYH